MSRAESSNNNSLAEKLAQTDMATHAKGMKCEHQFAWTIDNFLQLMDKYSTNRAWGEPKLVSIPLPEAAQETATMTVVCTPRNSTGKAEFTIRIKFSSLRCKPLTQVSIVLLDRTGSEKSWGTFLGKEAHSYYTNLSRGNIHYDNLLSEGRLTILFKTRIWLWPEGMEETNRSKLRLEHHAESAESLSSIMLDNNFVDLGGSSVLLVFQDGKQRCHTFPLAARENSLPLFLLLFLNLFLFSSLKLNEIFTMTSD
jgi:hypothetical protein